jgi:uncharacterized protein (DUF2062 family)
MSRRFFKRLTPKSSAGVRKSWLGRRLGPLLDAPLLWQLNRKSVARGVCCGAFWAFVPLPIQTIGAILAAVWLRGNLPMAMLATWISNPLTWVPVFYAGYRVGLAVLGMPEDDGELLATIKAAFGGGVIDGTGTLLTYFRDNLLRVLPLMLGNMMLGTLAAGALYFLVKIGWRWNIVRRWGQRGHHVRCPHCRHLVLGGRDDKATKACPTCGKIIPVYRRLGWGLAAISRKLSANVADKAGALASKAGRKKPQGGTRRISLTQL